ncbi:hypothetical protein N7532_001320 [Penicillium argentinense]|uniref:Uncharacterized protein n=1 Tax=Penicillium argentinense TaxID=1131581 RepID=A0A9W9G297_9EURO|nr:uncharacterized protein N7532_001320 [Penicillium argentinense]KAJ5110785.1 hypothetical protein N7532_001320 [Penicillium argentinense]
MSCVKGQLREHRHGVIGEVEAGRGTITRQANGYPTRFNFKTPFPSPPSVSITPIFNGGMARYWTEFRIYFFHPSGGPSVDKDGFYLGIMSNTGESFDFEYFASEIIEDKEEEEKI